MRATEYFNSDETANRYFRIMALSSVDLLFTIPLLIFPMPYSIPHLFPWISWADTKIRACLSSCFIESVLEPPHSTGFSRIELVPSTRWRNIPNLPLSWIELARWIPVMTSFVWLFFFGYTSETRRLYGPILRRIFTPFATRRSALEPLAFGSGAAQPRHRPGETSNFSGFSTDRGDVEDTQAPTVTKMTAPAPPDIESQAEKKGEGPGGGWKRWLNTATGSS